MSEEKKGLQNKITCSCGSVIFEKNKQAHCKTKKHQASLGPVGLRPVLHKGVLHKPRGVDFAKAQLESDADLEEDDEISEDELAQSDADPDEIEDGEEDELEQDADDILEEVLMILESLDNRVNDLTNQCKSLLANSSSHFERLEEVRSKVNLCLGEVRDTNLMVRQQIKDSKSSQPSQSGIPHPESSLSGSGIPSEPHVTPTLNF